ncbi:MAG: alpha/beta fold hydrolase [Nocardioides sp.]|uniref:alpha/beta fold hydrolase n=1 Tax=Nocardioides sp. TaxID=35761 RepID=UPI0039E4C9AA
MTGETRIPGAVTIEHRLTVPLVHDGLGGDGSDETIEVFAREIADLDGRDRPFLVFLQGGPGFEAPRPGDASSPAWLGRALRDYRVLMLDQRGTGLSTPYAGPGPDAAADAARLTHFRADAIVADAEAFRQHLGVERWSVLGQSFGGFCALRYLSAAPDSLREAFFTGGLPPVGRPAEEVYATTYATMRLLDERYHRRFPGDRERLERLLGLCDEGVVLDPQGEPISRRLLRTIGNVLGKDGGAETLHYLLELDPRSAAFRHDVLGFLPFDGRNPLYSVVHESCYADGGTTRWAADRALPDDFAGDSLLLTGEHLYPWTFEETPGLRPYREVAGILAGQDWPRLYDAGVLSSIDLPCAAAVYYDDPFVDRVLSLETAELIPTMRPWITSEYLHSGLRASGEHVLDRLIALARGRVER